MADKQKVYSKIPNKFFYSSIEGEKSIFAQAKYNEKALLILEYLYLNTNRRNLIKFTLEDMIVQCGFKCSTKKNESNAQFKELLSILQRNSIIDVFGNDGKEPNPLIENFKPKELIKCSLKIDYDNNFVMLEDHEKDKIFCQEIDKVNNLKLLLYYCYLKCRIYKRRKDDDLQMSGGRPEVGFPSFKTINEDLHITDDTIDNYNQILVKLDLIRIGSAGNWHYADDPNKVLRDSCNIYALFVDEETTNLNLKEGIKFYKYLDINSNKIFTNSKEYKNNNKRLNGELGSLIKKEKLGTITEKDIARKNEIINSINANDEQYSIKALLESNPERLISDIFDGFANHKKANKFYELEIGLGLINDDCELLVGYEYYKWIMINYSEDRHSFYVNCVKKHKREKRVEEDQEIIQLVNELNNSIQEDNETVVEVGQIINVNISEVNITFTGNDE